MRALKIVVVVMGIMLVVGFAALVAVIAGRVSGGGSREAVGRSFTTAAIEIPRGARIEAMTTAPNRLILDLVLPDGEHELVFMDLTSGARLGTIKLHPAP
ncbi:MAG TPA: DUF6476 family protein [Stellaceae bacterium]|nr:DUF6476 family protein [Stellaceae bacterium]